MHVCSINWSYSVKEPLSQRTLTLSLAVSFPCNIKNLPFDLFNFQSVSVLMSNVNRSCIYLMQVCLCTKVDDTWVVKRNKLFCVGLQSFFLLHPIMPFVSSHEFSLLLPRFDGLLDSTGAIICGLMKTYWCWFRKKVFAERKSTYFTFCTLMLAIIVFHKQLALNKHVQPGEL